jgi:integrase
LGQQHPSPAILTIEQRGIAYYEAKFRYRGQQVKRRIGRAWLDRDPQTGKWVRRRGRVKDGFYDERTAHVAAAKIALQHAERTDNEERALRERQLRGATVREVAHAYLRWLEEVKGAKPATIRNHQSVLGEPGEAYRRGRGTIRGPVIAALGDRPAAEVTTREVETLLARVSRTAVSARTVNKYRAVISAAFNYGMRESTFGLPSNPAAHTDKRREPQRDTLPYYSPEHIEALARALQEGKHRDPTRPAVSDDEKAVRAAEDYQDAVLVRVAAYAGLRLGELLALQWGDIDFARSTITVRRALSAGVQSTTKSGRIRRVPLPDQLAAALDSLSRREDFTSDDDLVFCNAFGRILDGSALRRRYKAARDAAGLRELRFHDLRHTYGSNLAAAGVDLVTIQSVMGHGALATTSRYLHARDAAEQAEVFTKVFEPATPDEVLTQSRS